MTVSRAQIVKAIEHTLNAAGIDALANTADYTLAAKCDEVLHMYLLPLLEEAATPRTLEPPREPGHVAFVVEVIPHDWANDGMGWHKGRDTPERVAAVLRDYADQVELAFTPPNPPPPPTEAEMLASLAAKFRKEGR